MLVGALADAGEHTEASMGLHTLLDDPLTGFPAQASSLAIRHLTEACRVLGDSDRAKALLPHVEPWAGQLLVVPVGTSIEGASDRSIGHLLVTRSRICGYSNWRLSRCQGTPIGLVEAVCASFVAVARPYADPVEIVTAPIPAQSPFIPTDSKIVVGAVAPASPDPIPIVLLPGFEYRLREWRHPSTHEVHWLLERRKSAQHGDDD